MDIKEAILEHEIKMLKQKKQKLLNLRSKEAEVSKLNNELKGLSAGRFGNFGRALKTGFSKMQNISVKYGPNLQNVEDHLWDMDQLTFKKKKK